MDGKLEQDLAEVGRALGPLTSRPSQRANVRKRDRLAGDARQAALGAWDGEAAAADAAVPAPVKKKRRQKGRGSAVSAPARRTGGPGRGCARS